MNKPRITHQYQLNQLANDTSDVIKDKTLSQGFNKTIKGVTENVADVAQPLIGGDDFIRKIANLRAAKMMGKKVLSALPLVGGLASAAMTGDASAAVPVLDSAESLGPEKGTLDHRLEMGQLTDEDKQQLRMNALKGMRN